MIEQYTGDGSRYGMELTYSYDGDELLGTGGAIKKIEDILPEAFFILYGDSYLEIPYAPVEDTFLESGKKGLMTVYENEDLYDASNVVFRDGELVGYSKKNKAADMRHIDYGLGILRREVLAGFPGREVFDLANVYEKLALEQQLLGYEVFKRFYEIGSPGGLEELRVKLGEASL
jgi:NDP-sugar pyrophosphorylase family protein